MADKIIGQTLNNRYQVIESLGRGGMAEVYKVWDTQRGTHLAMKVLREDLAEDRVFLRRFQREAHNLAKLQHPNIVRFYGLEQEGRLAFILMDYIQGSTLRGEIFDAQAPLPMERILPILQPVCSALHYAHQQGIVHCDLKSANIMLDANGKVYLTDFGIARMSDAATATLVGVGTPAYMAPELVKGMDPSPQTDIYALGVVLYELLTGGERPFTGEKASITGTTAEKVRWEQLNQTPVSPRTYNPAIPGALENVVLRCLVKEPKERYPHALELLNALQAALPSPAPGTQTRRSATQTFDQPRKETSKPESAQSGKFENGVYREAAPFPEKRTPEYAPEKMQAAAPKPPSSGKRSPAAKNFSYAWIFIWAVGLLALLASISAQRSRQEEMRRQATQTAAYEATATTAYQATATTAYQATAATIEQHQTNTLASINKENVTQLKQFEKRNLGNVRIRNIQMVNDDEMRVLVETTNDKKILTIGLDDLKTISQAEANNYQENEKSLMTNNFYSVDNKIFNINTQISLIFELPEGNLITGLNEESGLLLSDFITRETQRTIFWKTKVWNLDLEKNICNSPELSSSGGSWSHQNSIMMSDGEFFVTIQIKLPEEKPSINYWDEYNTYITLWDSRKCQKLDTLIHDYSNQILITKDVILFDQFPFTDNEKDRIIIIKDRKFVEHYYPVDPISNEILSSFFFEDQGLLFIGFGNQLEIRDSSSFWLIDSIEFNNQICSITANPSKNVLIIGLDNGELIKLGILS